MNTMVRELLSASYLELEYLTYNASTEELRETYDIMVKNKYARTKLDMISRAIHARTPMKEIRTDMQNEEVRRKFEEEWTSMQKLFAGVKAKKQGGLAAD